MSEQSFTGGHAPIDRSRARLLERMAEGLHAGMEHALYAETTATARGLLQPVDPRVKLAGFLALIIAAVSSRSLAVIYALLALAIVLALASHISLSRTMKRVWLSVLFFTGLLSLPALFLVPGDLACRLPGLGWTVTWQGLTSFGFVVGRALTAASFAILLILTTPWPHVLKALRALRVPVVFIVILGMTYRYIFVLLQTALDMLEARRSRLLARPSRRAARRMATASLGVLLGKSMHLSEEVYLAMLARGYRGNEATLDEFALTTRDWIALAGFALLAALAFWFGLAAR
jgi:cobalt/nickel transport system permease protein